MANPTSGPPPIPAASELGALQRLMAQFLAGISSTTPSTPVQIDGMDMMVLVLPRGLDLNPTDRRELLNLRARLEGYYGAHQVGAGVSPIVIPAPATPAAPNHPLRGN